MADLPEGAFLILKCTGCGAASIDGYKPCACPTMVGMTKGARENAKNAQEECSCAGAKLDKSTGRIRCNICGDSWYLNNEEMKQIFSGSLPDCEVCGGDCASANPPVYNCPRLAQ